MQVQHSAAYLLEEKRRNEATVRMAAQRAAREAQPQPVVSDTVEIPPKGHFEDPPSDLEMSFWEFHRQNPTVYARLCTFFADKIAQGHRKSAVNHAFETMRADFVDCSISNNHRPYYARLWLREHPDYPRFLKVVKLQSR
jgi:hypothetical protein